MAQKPNLLLIITDQQRASQHFDAALTPEQRAQGLTWDDLYLPSMKKLKSMGASFENAIIGASMCSPSRAAFTTSSYSFQNGVPFVGDNLAVGSQNPQIPNLCRLIQSQGYFINWKGKWHLGNNFPQGVANPTPPQYLDGYLDQSSPAQDTTTLAWNPPDAGTQIGDGSIMGAGDYNNDLRFLQDPGGGGSYVPHIMEGEIVFNPQGMADTVGMIAYLDNYMSTYFSGSELDPNAPPFCLIASFVNPHDVNVFQPLASTAGYPMADDIKRGIPADAFDIGNANNPPASLGFNIPVPPNAISLAAENQPPFTGKPGCQQDMAAGKSLSILTNLNSDPQQYSNGGMCDAQRFINFYAYLHTVVDRDISRLLDWFEADPKRKQLLGDTIIVRFADHGEQAISQGFREKGMNCCEETIKVPFIVANPNFKPSKIKEVVSLMDLVPTVAEIMGVPLDQNGQLPSTDWDPAYPISGKSLKSLIPGLAQAGVRKCPHPHGVVFSYEDVWYIGNAVMTLPSYIRCLRTQHWMYAIYFNPNTPDASNAQYELYNLSDTEFYKENPNQLLAPSMLEINNLVNVSAGSLSAPEQTALIQQWKVLHYTLLGLMANPSVKSAVPAFPGVTIPDNQMVNALPYFMRGTTGTALLTMLQDWYAAVTPTFQLPQ